MSVTGAANISTGLSPDGRGLRWYGIITVAGDASGGQVELYLNYSPAQEVYCIIDRCQAFSTNANTDSAFLVPMGFSDPFTWGQLVGLEGGLLTEKFGAAGFAWVWRHNLPCYVGRYSNTNASVMLQMVISPNTNLKSYNFVAQGRFLFREPLIWMKG